MNSNLAYTVLGVSLPASAYLFYIAILGAMKPFVLGFLVLFAGSIFIAIAGYAIHARLNYGNYKYQIRSIEIEETLGMYISRFDDKDYPLPLILNLKVEDLDSKSHWSENIFKKRRINDWYLAYISLLILGWFFLIVYNLYRDPIDTVLANLPISDGNFIIGNIDNNTNSTIKIDNITVNIR